MRDTIETFEEYVLLHAPYFETVREAGDLPWFEDPAKRAPALQLLGLPEDTPPHVLRRALWERRNR